MYFLYQKEKNQEQEEIVVFFVLFVFRGREFIKDEFGFNHVYYKT